MKKKTNHKNTSVKKETRREQNDRLVNGYMINMGWAFVAILALLGVRHGYRSSSTILYMQSIMWSLTAVFAVLAITLFVLSKARTSRRMLHYGYFMTACTAVGLWLSLFNKLRPMLEVCAQKIFSNPALTVSSYWNVRIPIIAIALYLIVGLIYLIVKSAKN